MYIKVSLIHDIQVLIYRGSTNERLSGEGVAYDSYYSETDRVTLNDDTKTNDNELHQQLCVTFKIDYLQEMDIIMKIKARLECKINVTLPALLPNKIIQDSRGPATSSDKTEHEEHSTRSKRAIPLLATV